MRNVRILKSIVLGGWGGIKFIIFLDFTSGKWTSSNGTGVR